jgi:hypothetical protein
LLRLTDHATPAMDKLYYAVRKMDRSLEESKSILEEIEKTISIERGATVQTRMMKYYLDTTGMEVNVACEELDKKDDDNNDDEDDDDCFNDEDDEPLPDDLQESDDDDSSVEELVEDSNEGEKIIHFWKMRSKKLRHEMAIAAWMCSPVEKIMQDAKEHHNGEERETTTALLKKWYCQETQVRSLTFYLLKCLSSFLFDFSNIFYLE